MSKWVGSEEHFIDRPTVSLLNHLVVGRFGGCSRAGQTKNEDGCLIWFNIEENWEFVVLLDAHQTAESAELILKIMEDNRGELHELLGLSLYGHFFIRLEEKIRSLFQQKDFRRKCQEIEGETSFLLTVRKDKYVWWFSVGDCLIYLFQPELAALSQFQLNQRHFYEWIGKINTFEQSVPCYSTGTRELRKGINHLFMTTDGLVECPNKPFTSPQEIYQSFMKTSNGEGVKSLLETIQSNNVVDNTTIISWKVYIEEEGVFPSN